VAGLGCSSPDRDQDDEGFLPRERDDFAADADADAYAGPAPFTVHFTAKTINGAAPVVYTWDFDDGSTSTARDPTHTYRRPGWYLVTMDARDATGRSYPIHLQLRAWKPSEWKRMQTHNDPRIIARSLRALQRKRRKKGWQAPAAAPLPTTAIAP
jgi:hypothetical protein